MFKKHKLKVEHMKVLSSLVILVICGIGVFYYLPNFKPLPSLKAIPLQVSAIKNLVKAPPKKLFSIPNVPQPQEEHDEEFRDWFKTHIESLYEHQVTIANNLREVPEGFQIGQPFLKVVIVSTWKSGSTLIADIAASHPSSLLMYEPLHHYGIERVTSVKGDENTDQVKIVEELLNCNFTHLKSTILKKKSAWPKDMKTILKAVKEQIFSGECDSGYEAPEDKCSDLEYLRASCLTYPITVVKYDRLSLKTARQILTVPKYKDENIKIIYLIRDPRAVIASRKFHEWCVTNANCIDPKSLCDFDLEDYHAARYLHLNFPNKFMVVRYEDLIINMQNVTEQMMTFLGVGLEPETQQKIDEAMKPQKALIVNHHVVYSSPDLTMNKWRYQLTFEQVQHIQEECNQTLKVWGFGKATRHEHLSTKDLVATWSLPDS